MKISGFTLEILSNSLSKWFHFLVEKFARPDGEMTYLIIKDAMKNFEDAQEDCEERGGDLASFPKKSDWETFVGLVPERYVVKGFGLT